QLAHGALFLGSPDFDGFDELFGQIDGHFHGASSSTLPKLQQKARKEGSLHPANLVPCCATNSATHTLASYSILVSFVI
ncbi:MAG: hypothetical protein ACK5S9_04770, partial [Roseiflexaceae bacterium]